MECDKQTNHPKAIILENEGSIDDKDLYNAVWGATLKSMKEFHNKTSISLIDEAYKAFKSHESIELDGLFKLNHGIDSKQP